MNLILSSKTNQPIYEQIYEQVVAQVLTGELKPDFCLPSIRMVARELGVSIITIKKAWELLENNHFIYTKAGKGCFVTEYARRHLDGKKTALAREKLVRDLPYYQRLGLSFEELVEIISQEY